LSKALVHGACSQPDHCECEEGWFGVQCDRKCDKGTFLFTEQRCDCHEGWSGDACTSALCERDGCHNGDCVAPDECKCFSGYAGNACSFDRLLSVQHAVLSGLTFALPASAPLLALRGVGESEDAWAPVKRWTGHLKGAQAVKQNALARALPAEDTILEPFRGPAEGVSDGGGTGDEKRGSKGGGGGGGRGVSKGAGVGGGGGGSGDDGAEGAAGRYATCAVVGNSGAMLRERGGRVIDEHDAVFRYNNAPTRRFEEHVGNRVSYHLINRAAADTLLEKQVIADPKNPHVRKFRAPVLIWRAESFSYFPLLVKKYPDDQLALLSPELLVKSIYNYKFAMKRMDAANVTVEAAQVAPGGACTS
jgi:hypothetical protein